MHIAYLINRYPTISHTFIRREIRAVEAAGHDVSRFAVRRPETALPDPADQEELDATTHLDAVPKSALLSELFKGLPLAIKRFVNLAKVWWRGGRLSPKGLGYHLIYVAEAIVLAQRMKAAGVDHIHAHFGTNPAVLADMVHALTDIPFSFTVHGPEEFDNPGGLDLAGKASSAKFVVAISSFGRSQLMRWMPFDQWDKIKIVHCGLDFSTFAAPEDIPSDAGLLFIGRLSEQKGVPLLIRAAAKVKDQIGRCPINIIGGGELESSIRTQISDLGLTEDVRLMGYKNSTEIQDALTASRALVVPSFAEGLPVVIMEAMAMGRPVISSTINGIPELVKDGVHGRLTIAGDVDSLADAMIEALSLSEKTLTAIGSAARDRVHERHNVQDQAGKLLAAISE